MILMEEEKKKKNKKKPNEDSKMSTISLNNKILISNQP
jgi:hypothetical protein